MNSGYLLIVVGDSRDKSNFNKLVVLSLVILFGLAFVNIFAVPETYDRYTFNVLKRHRYHVYPSNLDGFDIDTINNQFFRISSYYRYFNADPSTYDSSPSNKTKIFGELDIYTQQYVFKKDLMRFNVYQLMRARVDAARWNMVRSVASGSPNALQDTIAYHFTKFKMGVSGC